MAEEDYNPAGNSTPFGPAGSGDAATPTTGGYNPASGNSGPILSQSFKQVPSKEHGPGSLWHTVTDPIIANVKTAFTNADKPVFSAPVQSPLFSGIPQGFRNAIDYGAEKLALGGEAILGDSAKSLPGYRSAEQIKADIEQRRRVYEDKPENEAGSNEAMIGRGLGSAGAIGGPLATVGKLGGALTTLLGTKFAPAAMPYIARALDYLGGGAEAAKGASLPARLATRAGSLAAQGAGAGAGTAAVEADTSKPIIPQILEGAGSGAVAGPVAGALTSAVTYPVRAGLGLLPNMVDQDIVPLAKRFIDNYKIELDPSQLTKNPAYKAMTDQAGKFLLSGAGDRIATARLQWQRALADDMGEVAENGITHEVMKRAADRIGPGIGAIADRTTIRGGAPLAQDLTQIATDMPRFGLTDIQRPRVEANIKNVTDAFTQGNGSITGKTYQSLVQTGGPLDDIINSTDPTIHAFGLRIKDAIDSAFQRSAAPGDRAALTELRRQYRTMKTIEPLAEQKGLTGDIDPNSLMQRVRAQSAKFDPSTGGLAYTGGGKLGDLAYGGQIFFGKPADSNTTNRAIVAGLVGGGLTAAITHPAAAAGTMAGLLANRGAQKVLRSPAVGASMIENSANPPGPWVQRLTPYAVPGLLGL